MGIRFRSRNERDPCAIEGEIEVSAYPTRRVADNKNRTETIAAANKIPMKVALEETSMLLTVPGIATRRQLTGGWQENGGTRDFC